MTAGQCGGQVTFEQGSERLLTFPLRMLWRERINAGKSKIALEKHRLLGPKRAVVVNGGDALVNRHEIPRTGFRHILDKSNDGLLWRSIVPGWQGISSEGCVYKQY